MRARYDQPCRLSISSAPIRRCALQARPLDHHNTQDRVAHEHALMERALLEARLAGEAGEVPVGALVVDPATKEVVAAAGNACVGRHDPTAHAEILALRAAAAKRENYRLTGLWLICTLEPCVMCAGAISHARIGRLVYGARDVKGGAVEHGPRFFEQPTCHWRPDIVGGVAMEPCAELLRVFFKARRS